MALSALEWCVFLAAVLTFIYSAYNLSVYVSLNSKVQNMDTNKYKDTCGTKHGNVTAGMGFSVVMLVVSILVMIFYGMDVFRTGQSVYASFTSKFA